MRESIGGSMLFWIILFFLSIFIIFIGSVIKYARVYKIKNSMINYIERNEGVSTKADFESELNSMGYKGDYTICKYLPTEVGGFYFLELYATFEVPIVGDMFDIKVAIKGETRLIKTGTKVRTTGNWFEANEEACKTSG